MIKNKVTLNEKRNRKKKFDSVSYLTGDITLNIDRFNKAMGTYEADSAPNTADSATDSTTVADANGGGALAEGNITNIYKKQVEDKFNSEISDFDQSHKIADDGLSFEIVRQNGKVIRYNVEDGWTAGSLTEAKRYVRRYYIRPQNIFCSNKTEIIKALIELDDANCTVYTLNNLGDEKDVSKLMNNDIIYYYDDGILYDKNRVKVMDYDLSIKKEENRKHFTNVEKAPNKEFKSAYSDRMTTATELEEEAFNLTFEDYNVFGERLTEAKENFCCICGEPIEGYGNNPEPFMSSDNGQCCHACNVKFVIPMRFEMKED